MWRTTRPDQSFGCCFLAAGRVLPNLRSIPPLAGLPELVFLPFCFGLLLLFLSYAATEQVLFTFLFPSVKLPCQWRERAPDHCGLALVPPNQPPNIQKTMPALGSGTTGQLCAWAGRLVLLPLLLAVETRIAGCGRLARWSKESWQRLVRCQRRNRGTGAPPPPKKRLRLLVAAASILPSQLLAPGQ